MDKITVTLKLEYTGNVTPDEVQELTDRLYEFLSEQTDEEGIFSTGSAEVCDYELDVERTAEDD